MGNFEEVIWDVNNVTRDNPNIMINCKAQDSFVFHCHPDDTNSTCYSLGNSSILHQDTMSIRLAKDAKPFETPSGEIIDEVFGDVGKETTNHSIAIVNLPSNKGSDLHYHPVCEETYYMMEGTAKMVMWPTKDNKTVRPSQKGSKTTVTIGVGDAVAIPPNYWHQISNGTPTTVKFLVSCAPSWTPDCSVYYDQKIHGPLSRL